MAALILRLAKPYLGRSVLEIGTSRGRLTALLAEAGLRITTLDREDRGAAANLAGLPVTVLREELVQYLSPSDKTFDLVVVDLHGNTAADWNRYHASLIASVAPGGMMLINNATLNTVQGWQEETGVSWFLANLPADWTHHVMTNPAPGLAVVRRP
jgi:protein-L-isoaspartate O-methyltransferase